MSSNQALIDNLTVRQILVQRYSSGEAKRLLKHLRRLSSRLRTTVGTDYSVSRAVSTARKIEQLTNAILTEYGDDLIDGARKFAAAESKFAGEAILAATSAIEYSQPSISQLFASITRKKMGLLVGDSVQELSIDQAVKQFSKKKSREIAQVVRDGAATGRTLKEITNDVVGLVDTRIKSQAESLVRTTTNHIGAVARSETYKANDDVIIGEEFVATLDSRTTITCSSLDGQVYPIGEGAQPPLHWSCRSVRTPVVNPKYNLGSGVKGKRASVDGLVPANTTYGGWLKKQSSAVQDEVLGIERAKLFRSGKLSIGRFTDDLGRVYTLEELERLNPLAF